MAAGRKFRGRKYTDDPVAAAVAAFASTLPDDLPLNYEVFLSAQPGPQSDILIRTENEILFGGARGGGKTHGGMLWLIKGNPDLPQDDPVNISYLNHRRYRALVLRRQLDDLKDWIDRAIVFFCADAGSPLGAKYFAQSKTFLFPSGAKIICAHLKDESSFHKYRGHQYHRILFEELTQIPTLELYLELFSSCRSINPELRPQMLSTTNPDGPGLDWVRKRFLKHPKTGLRVPSRTVIRERHRDPRTREWSEITRVFIPSTIVDNPKLLEADPTYYVRLKAMSPAKQRAYIYGDWDALSGSQFFEDFRPEGPRFGEPQWANHRILRSGLQIPSWWWRGYGMDWGFNHRLCIYGGTREEPTGRLIIYDELTMRKTGAQEAGRIFGRRVLPQLLEMDSPRIPIFISHDAFHARNADAGNNPYSVVDLFAKGIGEILGPESVYTPTREELTAMEEADKIAAGGGNWLGLDYLDLRDRISKARVMIRKAPNARIPGWELIRNLLNWRGWDTNPQELDIEYALKLLQGPGGANKYVEYYNSVLKTHQRQDLPKMLICGDTCPYLMDAIPRAVYDTDGEDIKKVDADPETGEGGDDEIDALRYLVGGYAKSQSQEPRELALRRCLTKIAAQWPNGEIPGHLIQQAYAGAEKLADRERAGQVLKGFSIPRRPKPMGLRTWLTQPLGGRIQ